MELSKVEIEIIQLLRGLVPYEEIKIMKDKNGKPECYFIVRTQKIVLSKEQNEGIPLD